MAYSEKMTTKDIVIILEQLLKCDLTAEQKTALCQALDIVEEHTTPGFPEMR